MSHRPPAPRVVAAVRAALREPGAPPDGAHVLVAASGGPDSTALLAALVALAPAHRLRVTAAHVAHGLRGAEGEADRVRVRALAAHLGVDVVDRDVAIGPGAGLEARARRARHAALVAMAQAAGAARIALAHTADDQAETLLLRLVRGAGRGGLAGMRVARGRIWRPLLAVTRADVRRYLAEAGLAAAVDRSNADLAHARNRMRRLVLPLLAAEFNPRLVPSLAALATRLRAEDDLLASLARVALERLRREDHLAVAVAQEPPGLARRIVRAWLETHSHRGVGAEHVERVLGLARGAARGTVAVPGPARVLRDGDRLVRRPGRTAAVTDGSAWSLVPGATLTHPVAGWRLVLSSPRARRAGETRAGGAARALFDAAALPAVLLVRGPRPGDRVAVPGVGTRKVHDVLVDAKVAREDRPHVPLLVADDAVVWVAGLVRGAGARLAPGTTDVVEARLERFSDASLPLMGPHGTHRTQRLPWRLRR